MLTDNFNQNTKICYNIKHLPLRNYQGTDLRKAICSILRTAAPEYFDALTEKADNASSPEAKQEALHTLFSFNSYVDDVILALAARGADTYDTIGAALEMANRLEDEGCLPEPEKLAIIAGNDAYLRKLGIRKPVKEFLETEEQFEARRRRIEEKLNNERRKNPNRVQITMPLYRAYKIHNARMEFQLEEPKNFAASFRRSCFTDAPKPAAALAAEISSRAFFPAREF